ncbi:hypothetical protein J6590_031292 [Homalodisca vitripennis]|nr:hypothetical protein J6590_031292 [Homalodisca vitripennis]
MKLSVFLIASLSVGTGVKKPYFILNLYVLIGYWPVQGSRGVRGRFDTVQLRFNVRRILYHSVFGTPLYVTSYRSSLLLHNLHSVVGL